MVCRVPLGPSRRDLGAGSGWSRVDDETMFTRAHGAHSLLILADQAHRRGDQFAADALKQLEGMPAVLVNRAAEAALLDLVNAIWLGGWQPKELHRQGRRGCQTAAAGRLVGLAIAFDHAGRRAGSLDRQWIAQIDRLNLPEASAMPDWTQRWADAENLDRQQTVAAIVDVLANLMHLPELEPLLPPPGSRGTTAGWSARSDGVVGAETDPVLDRIRSMLTKAESTTFEAEAAAFTAKARELLTRHAIDAALVNQRSGLTDERPVAIRVPIDAPYVDVKSLLLQTVAEAGRCRAVFQPSVALSTVVGFPADVAAVEMLFTSLLVQAQTTLADTARRALAGTRTRRPSYKSAFLLAYTARIGHRLQEINDTVFSEAAAVQGAAFLPVLRSRDAEVDDFLADNVGELTSIPVRGGHDLAGWSGGRFAADNAQLSFGDLAEQNAAPDNPEAGPVDLRFPALTH